MLIPWSKDWICVGLTQARLNMPLALLVTIRIAVQVEVKANGFQSGANCPQCVIRLSHVSLAH